MHRYLVIADAAEARIFSLTDRDRALQLVCKLSHSASRSHIKTSDGDSRGRVRKGMGRQIHSAMEPRTDAHTVEMQHFAKEIAAALQEARSNHAFEELAIIAPPKFLGILRKEAGVRASKAQLTCVAMEGTQFSVQDIPRHIHDSLVGWLNKLEPREAARETGYPWLQTSAGAAGAGD